MTNNLMEEDRVPLSVLAAEFGVDRNTIVRWAKDGFGGRRIEWYRIGKKMYSSRQAAARFLAAMNGKPSDSGVGADDVRSLKKTTD